MLEFFCEGGWGMYPTMFSGLFLLGASIQYARFPAAYGRRLLWVLSGITLLTGFLGFVMGFIRTLSSAAVHHEHPRLIWAGTAESLHNIALALALVIAAAILIACGVARDPGPSRA